MIEQEELLEEFIDEALQHFQTIEPDLLELEKEGDRTDEEIINRLFRGMHSIKGAAGFFGLKNINDLGHTMESLLSLIREKRIKVETNLVDTLLTGVDILRSMVEDVTNSDAVAIGEIMERLQQHLNGTSISSKKEKLFEITQGDQHGRCFELPEDDIKRFIKGGNEVYSVEVYLNKDIADQKKTPFDFINNMTSIGEFINVSFSYDKISGLDDCLDYELSIIFLFSTILEKDLVPTALGIPADQVRQVNLENHKKRLGQVTSSTSADKKDGKARHEPDTNSLQEPQKKGEVAENPAAASRQFESEEKIRVGVNIMNDLMNLAGELVLGRNQLMQTTLPLIKEVQGLNPVLQHVSRITTEMQGKIMQMRMQPVSVLFSKFHRVVRELAKKLGKEIQLITYGEDVELDKTIIEALADPMTHLIRNCCDHAIETPDLREKFGKSRQGTIELKAFHQAGQVHLEVIDDGAGIDGETIAKKALEKKIISESQLAEMTDQEKARLILKPGFSTAEKISDISGRGVGMDVVQTNISQLGGTLSIETEVGSGTKLSLMLPLTLAIVSGLVTRLNDQYFIIPEANIEEMVRIKPEEISQRINTIHNAKVLRLREKLLPLIDLKRVLNLAPPSTDPNDELSEPDVPVRVLVAKYGTSTVGMIVDSLENFEEIVVKPLPRYLKNLKSYSGASIMGNGQVSLILDVAGVVSKANLSFVEEKEDKAALDKKATMGVEENQTMLLFDNQTEERFALPLELITRIERVPATSIERVKDKSFMQYHGEELRLIFLEDFLPIKKPERNPEDTLGVIIPKLVKHRLGIVVGRVYGTVNESVHLDTKNIAAPGLFGSAILDHKITLLPDLFKLIEISNPDWHQLDELKKPKQTRVLLVDDTPFFRMIEAEYLSSAGYEVIVAENGRQALELLDKQKMDIVVLDIIMPVMDGWQVINVIRKDDRFKDLPVIAVTSLGDEQSRDRGLASGFTAWESKLNKELLLAKMEQLTM